MESNVTVNISPSPGFCVKSKVLHPVATSTHERTNKPLPISEGLKVFVNIAWSKDLPPPLDGIEKASGFAAHNARISKSVTDSPIPVFASNGRLDTDKGTSVTRAYNMQTLRAPELIIHFRINVADWRYDLAGKPALVFDCVFHSSLKTHALKDLEFKSFLVGACPC